MASECKGNAGSAQRRVVSVVLLPPRNYIEGTKLHEGEQKARNNIVILSRHVVSVPSCSFDAIPKAEQSLGRAESGQSRAKVEQNRGETEGRTKPRAQRGQTKTKESARARSGIGGSNGTNRNKRGMPGPEAKRPEAKKVTGEISAATGEFSLTQRCGQYGVCDAA